MKVGKVLDSKTKFEKKTNLKLEKKEKFSICSWNCQWKVQGRAGRQEASSKMRARHERSLGGQLSSFSFEGRWEDAPGAGLNAVLGEWMISASRRNSQRGIEEPTRGDTYRRAGRSWIAPDSECRANAAAGAWYRWRMTGMAVGARAWWRHVRLIEACQSSTSGTRPGVRYSNQHAHESEHFAIISFLKPSSFRRWVRGSDGDRNCEGQWSRADFLEPGGPGFDSLSRQPQVVAHQHWAGRITE